MCHWTCTSSHCWIRQWLVRSICTYTRNAPFHVVSWLLFAFPPSGVSLKRLCHSHLPPLISDLVCDENLWVEVTSSFHHQCSSGCIDSNRNCTFFLTAGVLGLPWKFLSPRLLRDLWRIGSQTTFHWFQTCRFHSHPWLCLLVCEVQPKK